MNPHEYCRRENEVHHYSSRELTYLSNFARNVKDEQALLLYAKHRNVAKVAAIMKRDVTVIRNRLKQACRSAVWAIRQAQNMLDYHLADTARKLTA